MQGTPQGKGGRGSSFQVKDCNVLPGGRSPLFFLYFETYFLILYSAERAWAVRLSPRARMAAVLPSVSAPT
jgi:hypothetical protein